LVSMSHWKYKVSGSGASVEPILCGDPLKHTQLWTGIEFSNTTHMVTETHNPIHILYFMISLHTIASGIPSF
jgi:hypothetical protein